MALEVGVFGAQGISNFPRPDVEERLRRSLGLPRRRLVGILLQNLLKAGHRVAVALRLAFLLDLPDQLRDAVLVRFGTQVPEGRQLREVYKVAGGEVVSAEVLATVLGAPLFGQTV